MLLPGRRDEERYCLKAKVGYSATGGWPQSFLDEYTLMCTCGFSRCSLIQFGDDSRQFEQPDQVSHDPDYLCLDERYTIPVRNRH